MTIREKVGDMTHRTGTRKSQQSCSFHVQAIEHDAGPTGHSRNGPSTPHEMHAYPLQVTSSPREPCHRMTSTVSSSSNSSVGNEFGRKEYLSAASRIALLAPTFYFVHFANFLITSFEEEIISRPDAPMEIRQLSSYWIGLLYTISAVLVAWFCDYLNCRARTLGITAALGGLCLIAVGGTDAPRCKLAARVGMAIFHSGIEPLGVSLVSDMLAWPEVFLGMSFFYLPAYLNVAIASHISGRLRAMEMKGWAICLICAGSAATGIAGATILLLPEPRRQKNLIRGVQPGEDGSVSEQPRRIREGGAWKEVQNTCRHMLQLNSMWILVITIGIRQLAGSLYTSHMPSYLSSVYPNRGEVVDTYGLVVGVAGSVSVLIGGTATWCTFRWVQEDNLRAIPIWMTAIGGMVGSIFLVCTLVSSKIAEQWTRLVVLYTTLAVAFLASETWLGIYATGILGLLDPSYKTFGFALTEAIRWAIWTSGPELLWLRLTGGDRKSEEYAHVVLCVLVPTLYVIAGAGLILAIRPVRQDVDTPGRRNIGLSPKRKWGCAIGAAILTTAVASLLAASIAVAPT
ncbi:MFS general substrate transporter [Lophiostoma macrostomum CBS 122681]|uniref:MFS general substrate transporter n=1 Tax=Lophiostoma macrostomum CBS 122681 TaxID=1314788 RepID=A0A6A6TFJ3_9PLEO|nr:MFS general substrate transporter [Lophiostoma macrostomum CBS 122681]